MPKGICKIEGCEKPVCNVRGWCNLHYLRWLRNGTPGGAAPARDCSLRNAPVDERFWGKVNKDGHIPAHRPELGPCWEWTASRPAGYGHFALNGRPVQAHRFAYEALIGPIPAGLDLDHLCRVRRCVNPAHLEPVTRGVNVLRGEGLSAKQARQTHCKRGHPFDAENTHVGANGKRYCRICQHERNKQRNRKRSERTAP